MPQVKPNSRPSTGIRCSACGGEMRPFFETRDYNRALSTQTYRYLRCAECGLASLVNVPADLGPFYANGYHVLPPTEEALEAQLTQEQYKIDLVRRFASSGRLLEIGPSWGAFCLLAKRAGFAVEAIEMDPTCCDFLRSRIGVRAICRSDEAVALEEATAPDVIAAWHVLEHLRDPWRLIDVAARRLAPGGVLVVALPNPRAIQFRLLRQFWVHVDAPRHLHLVPPAVVRKRAEAAGLAQLLATTADAGSLNYNAVGWIYSLPHLASSPFLKRALRFTGRQINRVVSPVERREGLGSAYTLVFGKPPRGEDGAVS